MSSLALPDRVMIERDAVALHAFKGEQTYGELSYSAGDRLRIYCEDMGEGWSLAKLLCPQGEGELDDLGGTRLTRGTHCGWVLRSKRYV